MLLRVVFGIFDLVLQTEAFARPFFDKFRSADNVREVLKQVYVNHNRVDDMLVERCVFCLRFVVLVLLFILLGVFQHFGSCSRPQRSAGV